jgi:hypothetical protein
MAKRVDSRFEPTFSYKIDHGKCEIDIYPAAYSEVCEAEKEQGGFCFCRSSKESPCYGYTLPQIATIVFVRLMATRNEHLEDVLLLQRMRSKILSLKPSTIKHHIVLLAKDYEH